MSSLTQDQLKRIEENRRKALAIKASKVANSVKTDVFQTSAIKPSGGDGTPIFHSKEKFDHKSSTRRTNDTPFKCSVVQGNRFSVTCMYNPKFVTVFKSISSRKFDPETKGWSFNLSDFCNLSEKFKAIGHELPQVENAVLVKSTQGSIASIPLNTTCKGMCRLISRQRFEVDMSYHAECVSLFKTMPSRSYDVVNRRWSFELTDYNKLIHELRKDSSICVEPLPSYVVKVVKDSIAGKKIDSSIPEHDLLSIDDKIASSLMPFQKEGVNFAISRNGRILLADDMGLGKTVQSICIAAYYHDQWPLLVVCPSSVRLMWKEALLRWLPNHLSEDDINVILAGRDYSFSCTPVTIISYDLLTKKQKELEDRKYKVVILDESHFIKNYRTARARAAIAVLKNVRHVLLLSGTPALSRPVELYTQLSVIRPDLFPHFHQFGLRYCDAKQNAWGWEYSGSSNMGELRIVLQESIMLRRTKVDVLTQLPPKLRRSVALDVSGIKTTFEQKRAIDEVKAAVRKNGLSALEKHGILLQYFNETAHLKLAAVKSYVFDLLESGHKFLLFAHHRTMLDSIQRDLNTKKIDYIRIDGQTPSERRQSEVSRFQKQSNCKVALLSITAANMGITLSAASLVIFAELFWNPGILVQAEDRCYRIGQRDVVNVHYLVAKGTADDYIWQMVKDKLEILSKAGLNCTNFNDTESHVAKKRERNDLLNYFQATKDVSCCSNQCQGDGDKDDNNDDDDLLLLEALERAESRNDGTLHTAGDHKSSDVGSRTSTAVACDVPGDILGSSTRKRTEEQARVREQIVKRSKK